MSIPFGEEEIVVMCCPEDKDAKAASQGINQVIMCLALPGTASAFEVGDSWVPPSSPDWIVLKTSAQVLPQYVIHFYAHNHKYK